MTNYTFVKTFLFFSSLMFMIFLSIDVVRTVFKKQRMTESLLFFNQSGLSLFVLILNVGMTTTVYIIQYLNLYSYIFCVLLELLCFGLALFYKINSLKEFKNLYKCMDVLLLRNKELGLQVEAIVKRVATSTETNEEFMIFLMLWTLFDQKEMPPEILVKEVQRILNF